MEEGFDNKGSAKNPPPTAAPRRGDGIVLNPDCGSGYTNLHELKLKDLYTQKRVNFTTCKILRHSHAEGERVLLLTTQALC